MAATLWISGVGTLLANLKKVEGSIQANCQRGVAAAANHLRNKSIEIVPVQTGILKASCHAPRNVGGAGFKCDYVISYGAGPSGEYAVYVHEDLTKAHGKEFNIKHAQEIAAAGHFAGTKKGTYYPGQTGVTKISARTGKKYTTKWKSDSPLGTTKGGMFPRGSNQQAKFLEQPMRTEKRTILEIIARFAMGFKR